jgi:DNA-3-methyladenine glycosylase II
MAGRTAPPTPPDVRRIESQAHIAHAVAALLAADPRLNAVAEIAGPLPLRRRAGGFEGLAAIVTAQQISGTAAASIWTRLQAAVDPFTPEQFLLTPEEALRTAGLSRPKIRTLFGIAGALSDGFDLAALHDAPADEAVAAMVALNGVGPWTAEIYLLFCVGHPDVFPSGDLALQSAVGQGLGLPERPSDKALREIARVWSPWRGVAARMFWAYYSVQRLAAKGRIPGPGQSEPL